MLTAKASQPLVPAPPDSPRQSLRIHVPRPGEGLRLETVNHLDQARQARIDALAAAAREVDGTSPFGEHKWLRLVRGDDRCAALLLWRQEDLVAAAHCDAYHTQAPDRPCRLTAEMVVHPAHRRRGLGTFLAHGVLALARDECAAELHLWAYGDRPAARHLASSLGCRPERVLLQMDLPSAQLPTSEPSLPAGLRLRPFEPRQDAYRWLALHNRVFEAHPEQGGWDASDLQARMEQPWFKPRDVLLAEDATGDLLGFCWAKLPTRPDAPGEIYIVGVDPSARGQGLGRALVAAGLAHIRASGRPGATLYVEADNAPAVALYERLGFATRWRHVCYARSLPRE